MNARPICIDLFCGLGGWAEGFLAEGYDVIGFDIERHDYGTGGYPGQLVLQDVLTVHGSQFRNAACIVCSPPCQEYSYMAMPWKRAKQIAAALRGDGEFPQGYTGSRTVAQLNALFDACFRIQREASEAAGRHIPMVVENVKGGQPWVGPAKAHYGSFYLWGDVESVGGRIVPARRVQFGMPTVKAYRMQKIEDYSDPRRNGGKGAHLTCQLENDRRRCICPSICDCQNPEPEHGTAMVSNGCPIHNARPQVVQECEAMVHNNGGWRDEDIPLGLKVPGMNFHDFEKTGKPGRSFQSAAVDAAGVKQPGHSGRSWFADPDVAGHLSSKSSARKAASAQIAKIPFELARWIAATYKPDGTAA